MTHFRLIVAVTFVLLIAFLAHGTRVLAQAPTPLAPVTTSQEVNLLASGQGGQAIIVPNNEWLKPVTGDGDKTGKVNVGEEAVYAFRDEKPATFSKFSLLITRTDEHNIK